MGRQPNLTSEISSQFSVQCHFTRTRVKNETLDMLALRKMITSPCIGRLYWMKSEEINHLSPWQICLSSGERCPTVRGQALRFPPVATRYILCLKIIIEMWKCGWCMQDTLPKSIFPNDILSEYTPIQIEIHSHLWTAYTLETVTG